MKLLLSLESVADLGASGFPTVFNISGIDTYELGDEGFLGAINAARLVGRAVLTASAYSSEDQWQDAWSKFPSMLSMYSWTAGELSARIIGFQPGHLLIEITCTTHQNSIPSRTPETDPSVETEAT